MTPVPTSSAVLRNRFLVLVLIFLAALAALAQSPKETQTKSSAPVPAAAATTGHEITESDVHAFLDGIVPMQLAREDIAGATVVVVKDGKVLFTKGYGFSNVKKKTPVTFDTVFRPGSISKLFTWTAVMQLVERGKLDLDKDVNEYLDFQVPHTFDKPVTLRNLMTHTAGFEETLKDLEVETPDRLPPLATFMKTHEPRQIFPPGTVPAYSNYGADLAGYIVQRVSGQPYEEYIEQNIFAPLKMKTATFRQPLPEATKPLMSDGYRVASDEAQPFELVVPEPGPDGSLSASARDMVPFMIAHLQNGQYEGAQILRPETAQLMHARQFTMDPAVEGMCLGFYEENRNGHRIIGHGGDLSFFHSDLHLVPDAGVGFFVSYNSTGKGEKDPRSFLWEQFLDRYFPYSPTALPAITDAERAEAQQAVGNYVPSRRGETTVMSSLWYLLVGKSVSLKPDGTLEVEGMDKDNGQPKQWRAIGNMTFSEVDGQKKLVYQSNRMGGLLVGADPVEVYQRVSWSHSKSFLQILMGSAATIFALTVLLWPVAWAVRKHYGRRLKLPRQQAWLRLAVKLTCLCNLVFLAAAMLLLVYALQHLSAFDSGNDIWIRLLQLIAWLGVLGTLPVLFSAYTSWRTRGSGLWTIIYNTGVALACVGFVWFVTSFHLLSFSVRY
jgi:CubicO group peptidase (beta-lactamase class C family)